METTPPSRVLRGIFAGLGAAGVLSSFGLVAWSVQLQQTPCTSNSIEECGFQEAAQNEQVRVMRLASIGLSTIGVGCLWWLRALNRGQKSP